MKTFQLSLSQKMFRLNVPGIGRRLTFLVFAFLLLSGLSTYAQVPLITVRFANPQIDCGNMTYCVDVEFQSDAPDKRIFGMNTRFFYDGNVLEFINMTNFVNGYGPFNPNPPNVTSGNAVSGALMFSFNGAATYVNGAMQLINSSAPPVYISTTGWTRLYSICFEIKEPVATFEDGFCPSLLWDLEEDPMNGGFLPGSDGVVISVVAPPPAYSASVNENVVQFNWDYDAESGTPFGAPISTNCVAPCIILVANDDDFSQNAVCSFEGGNAGNVLLNDLINGYQPNPAQVELTIGNNGGINGATLSFEGNLIIPPATPAGLYSLSYRLNEYENTDNFKTANIQVKVTDPVFQCPPDMTVCLSEQPFALTGAVPGGGIFAGNGMITGLFNPMVAGIGTHFINYCVINPFTNEQLCCDFSVTVTDDQQVQLSMGWSGISSYILPSDQTMSSVLDPVSQQLNVIYNFDGIYWPDLGITTLNQWNPFSGYIARSSDIAVLPICGDAITGTPLELNAGWSIMPVLSAVPFNIEDLFSGVTGLVVVKEVAGVGVYWPAYNINTIGNLQPGKAYIVSLSSPATIDFSQQQKNISTIKPDNFNQLNTPWNMVTYTPASHLVAFNLEENPLKTGDIIGGFTQDGLCAGLFEFKNPSNSFAISLQGNDSYSDEVDGFMEQEAITFSVYRPSTGELLDLDVTFNPAMDQGSFETNGLSEVNLMKVSSTGVIIIDASFLIVYPNPTQGEFTINGLEGVAKIKIYNSFGKEVNKVETTLPASFNLGGVARGVYMIRIEAGQKMYFRKLIIN
ncbi:MAG: T9SS type A sorting domain-containing protein [Bacteroidales bacterium]|nr:T9SS type A sorting domain-containing protein [Bacteroidales bacterium]